MEAFCSKHLRSTAVNAAAAKSLQSCPTLCDPIDGSPRLPCPWDSPGKNTGVGCHFLLQSVKVKVKSLSRVRLLVTPRTTAYQAPPSTGFSRQEYWSGVPLPSPITCIIVHTILKFALWDCVWHTYTMRTDFICLVTLEWLIITWIPLEQNTSVEAKVTLLTKERTERKQGVLPSRLYFLAVYCINLYFSWALSLHLLD